MTEQCRIKSEVEITVTKFATFVNVVCSTMCTKFCNKRSDFDEITFRKTKTKKNPKRQVYRIGWNGKKT